MIPQLGLLGDPIRRSLSPQLFRGLAEKYRKPVMYRLLPVRRGESAGALRILHELNFSGLNVTVPLKEEVFDLLGPQISPRAREVGAVNVLVRKGRGWLGANTDAMAIEGMIRDDSRIEREPVRDVYLFGAGGAARAVVHAFARQGARRFWVQSRNLPRARDLKRHFEKVFSKVEIQVLPSTEGARRKTLPARFWVNATPSSEAAVRAVQEFFPKEGAKSPLFFDLVYRPRKTEFLRLGESHGASLWLGFEMLKRQAESAWKIWFEGSRP